MKHLILTAGMAVLSAALAGTASAAPIKMQPGLWEITVNVKMANMPRLQGNQVMHRCIKKTDSAKNRIIPQLETRPGMACKLTSFGRRGNTVTYTRVCTDRKGKTKSEGRITINSPTSYSATIHTTGRMRVFNVNRTQTVSAKRVGPCSG